MFVNYHVLSHDLRLHTNILRVYLKNYLGLPKQRYPWDIHIYKTWKTIGDSLIYPKHTAFAKNIHHASYKTFINGTHFLGKIKVEMQSYSHATNKKFISYKDSILKVTPGVRLLELGLWGFKLMLGQFHDVNWKGGIIFYWETFFSEIKVDDFECMVIFRDFRVNNSTNRPPSLQVIVGVEGFSKENKHKRQVSFLLRKSNLMQMCGHFEGFPLQWWRKKTFRSRCDRTILDILGLPSFR